ncbi:MAG: phosphotransferase [Lentisphaerae bacterium]|nr:phosphotransferase [Lentisphaerota bacterium]
MNVPRKAIVLAAGFGTRLDPLTRTLPKCLLPLWGRPMLEHTLATLASWGVHDVLINLHHAPQPVWDFARHAALHGPVRIACSYEPDILGTGGALRRAAWFLGRDPCWIVNGDIVFDVNPAPLQRAMRRPRAMAALMMTSLSGPRTVELARSGAVRTFRSTRPGTPGTVTFCGLQLVSPDILRHLADAPFSTIVTAYESAARSGRRIFGIEVPRSFWMDIGTPEGLLAAHTLTLAARRAHQAGGRFVPASALRAPAAWRRRGVAVQGFAALGSDVKVAPGACLRNVVAMEGAHVGAHATVADAILAPRARITGVVRRLAVPLDAARDADLTDIAARLHWPAAHTVVAPLAPRGSARSFTRLSCGPHRAMVIRYSLDRPENARFVANARYLGRLGIRVPHILLDWPERRISVIEDLGDRDLATAIDGQPLSAVRRVYARVIDAVAHWHVAGKSATRSSPPLEPPFGPELFRWEHDLFRTHFAAAHLGLTARALAPLEPELQRVAARLCREPQTLLHRDLQSSNVLFVGRQPAFIDFQGMRLGPAAYDVASLLADPYVNLSAPLQDALLSRYQKAAGIASGAAFDEVFWHAVVQRLLQALGAYGRLSRLPGMAPFARHIPPALDMLDRALGRLYTLPHLRAFVCLARTREARLRGAT